MLQKRIFWNLSLQKLGIQGWPKELSLKNWLMHSCLPLISSVIEFTWRMEEENCVEAYEKLMKLLTILPYTCCKEVCGKFFLHQSDSCHGNQPIRLCCHVTVERTQSRQLSTKMAVGSCAQPWNSLSSFSIFESWFSSAPWKISPMDS